MASTKKLSARALLQGWRVDTTGMMSAYFGKKGEWFQAPRSYPTILCDPWGYIRFESEAELRACKGIKLTGQLNCPRGRGISTIKGYVRCVVVGSGV